MLAGKKSAPGAALILRHSRLFIPAPAPVVNVTVLAKLLAWVFRVIFWVAGAPREFCWNVAAPVTASTPVCVSAPLACTASVPLTVLAPSTVALLLVSSTLLPLVIPTAPVNAFAALLRVMLLAAPAARVVVPATVNAPVWVMAPVVVALRLPPPVVVPKLRAPLVKARSPPTLLPLPRASAFAPLLNVAAFAPLLLRVTAPVKSLALPRAMTPAPAAMVAAPAPAACVTLPAPPSLMPTPVKASVPLPTDIVPSVSAALLVSTTVFAPLLVSDTAPVKLLPALFSVMALAPALKFEVPVTTKAPVWVMAPFEVTPKVPLTVLAANTVARLLVNSTLLPLVIPTAPVNALPALFRVMLLAAPAARVVVPATVKAPVWVIAPFEVTV